MRDILNVSFRLDRLACHDEGDGWGSAEPYLWTVFFKIDGETVVLTDDLKLAGSAMVYSTPGSHGNLGTTDVDAGDVILIPEAIGAWETTLKPIPVPDFVKQLGTDDLPGIAGVICVLMEEDNVTDDGAEAGHQALNGAVQSALDQIIATRSITNQEVTDGEIAQYVGAIESAASNAVQNQQNAFENFWSWLNADDSIGTQVWQFSQDRLLSDNPVQLQRRWQHEGDWELFGHIDTSVLCPAEAIRIIAELFNSAFKTEASEMRSFRDKEFARYEGLQSWWSLAARHTPQLSSVLVKDRKLLKSATSLLGGIEEALKNRDEAIPDKHFDAAQKIMEQMRALNHRRTRIDVSRALDLLPHLRGKSTNVVIEMLSSVPPTRHPEMTSRLGKELKAGRLLKSKSASSRKKR